MDALNEEPITEDELRTVLEFRNLLAYKHMRDEQMPPEDAQLTADIRLMVMGYRAAISIEAKTMADEVDQFLEGK